MYGYLQWGLKVFNIITIYIFVIHPLSYTITIFNILTIVLNNCFVSQLLKALPDLRTYTSRKLENTIYGKSIHCLERVWKISAILLTILLFSISHNATWFFLCIWFIFYLILLKQIQNIIMWSRFILKLFITKIKRNNTSNFKSV